MKVTIYAQFYAINTFDGNNPNIYYSNPHIGAGILGGSYAGLERDEQGNINGFNPQKFALGFASGAGLSKGLQLSTKRLEKLAIKHSRAKALLDKLKPKIDIMPKSKQDKGKNMLSDFLTEKGEIDFNKFEALSELMPQRLNYQNFLAQFKNTQKAIIKTPIANIEVNPKYMFYHLTRDGDKQGKIKGNGKENRVWLSGGILETLQNPLFVTKDIQGTHYFYKAFKNDKGLVNLVSIAVPNNNSKMRYKTSYNGTKKRITDMIKKHKMVYKAS